jgi:hypothetical protein
VETLLLERLILFAYHVGDAEEMGVQGDSTPAVHRERKGYASKGGKYCTVFRRVWGMHETSQAD